MTFVDVDVVDIVVQQMNMFSYCNGRGTSTKFSGIYPAATVIKFWIKWEIIPCIFNKLEAVSEKVVALRELTRVSTKGWRSRKFS